MKRYLFPLADGRFLEVKQNKIENALPYVEKRLAYWLPIECVDKDEIKKVISYIRVNVNRDCTKEEVNGLVASIKNLMLEALDHMQTYERHMWDKYEYDDMEGEEECLKSEKEIVQTASGTIRPVRSFTVKK